MNLKVAMYDELLACVIQSSDAMNETVRALESDPLHAARVVRLNVSLDSTRVLLCKVLIPPFYKQKILSSSAAVAAKAAKDEPVAKKVVTDSTESAYYVSAPVTGEKRDAEEVVPVAAKKVKTEEGSVAVAAAPTGGADAKTCFVANLAFDLDVNSIWAAFDEWIGAGSVVSVRLTTDHSGRPKG
jgi:hypothetical protein